MAVWLVRAGKYGEQEQAALDHDVATIGWDGLPDLDPVADKEALEHLYQQRYPNESPMTGTTPGGSRLSPRTSCSSQDESERRQGGECRRRSRFVPRGRGRLSSS